MICNKKLKMNIKHKFVYLIYLLLLTAITFFSVATLIEKPYFNTEKKLVFSDKNLANKFIEFSITDEKNLFDIKQKFDFHIITIKIQKKSSYEVSKKYNEIRELILNISKNYYEEEYNKQKVLIKRLNQDQKKIEDVYGIEKLVSLEFFLQDPFAKFNTIKLELEKEIEIKSIINRTKYIPIIAFLVITLLIFHFFRDKIIKSLKKL